MTRYVGLKVGVIQRVRGGSAAKRSRYQLREASRATRSEEIHSHSMYVSEGDKALGPSIWAQLDRRETRKNATLARTIDLPIPRTLPLEAYGDIEWILVRPFVERGYPVQFDIHTKTAVDGKPNPHIHMMIASRPFHDGTWSNRKGDFLDRLFRKHGSQSLRRVTARIINETAHKFSLPDLVHHTSNYWRRQRIAEKRLHRLAFQRPNRPSHREALNDVMWRRNHSPTWARLDQLRYEELCDEIALLKIDIEQMEFDAQIQTTQSSEPLYSNPSTEDDVLASPFTDVDETEIAENTVLPPKPPGM